MRKLYTYHQSALRFRRWSRKTYATFVSIQKAVTIGQLSSSVADRLHKKNLSLHSAISHVINRLIEEEYKEKEHSYTKTKYSLSLYLGLIMSLLAVLVQNKVAHQAYYTYTDIT